MKNDDDGFTLVTRQPRTCGKNKKSAGCKQQPKVQEPQTNNCSLPKETIVKQVTRAQKDLQSSEFLSAALKTADKALEDIGRSSVDHVLCYGLGNFSECVTARYQLAFLLCVRDRFQCPVSVYDPVFNVTEQQILPEEFTLDLIRRNEEGKRVISTHKCTLIFAPHCPKQLTNNFLWANWTVHLRNCIFLGNSFLKIIYNPSSRIESAQYILKISPYTNELALENIFRFKDVFNDLAYHVFNTSQIEDQFWVKGSSSPVYPTDDIGIVITSQNVSQFKNSSSVVERDSSNKLGEEVEGFVVG